MENKLLAIMGSPGSGKTTTAIKLAQILAARKKNVVIVFCDPFTPVVPSIMDAGTIHDTSLGTLFTVPTLTQKQILDACIPIKENDYISLLGYREKESLMHYPMLTKDRVVECFVSLRYLADYIILDCTSVFEADPTSVVAMDVADQVLVCVTANLKGVSFFESHVLMLSEKRFWKQKYLVLGNQKVGQDWQLLSNIYGGINYVLPYTAELERQENELALFHSLTHSESSSYQTELDRIAADIFSLPENATKTAKQKTKICLPKKAKSRNLQNKKEFSLPFRKRGEF